MFRKFVVAFLLCLAPTPAFAGFSKIEFKYTSLAHLGYQRSLVTTQAGVRETVDLIASFLRSSGASVSEISESAYNLNQTEGDRVCEQWVNSIYRAEFAAYDANKFSKFKKIVRTGSPATCLPKPHWLQYGFTATKRSGGEGFHIVATVDRSFNMTQSIMRPSFATLFGARGSANIWGLVPSTIASTARFETNFSISVWRDGNEDKTTVFVFALPRSDGVEAAPGASIGYAFRSVADGRIEAAAVQNLLSYVVQKSLLAPPSAAPRSSGN